MKIPEKIKYKKKKYSKYSIHNKKQIALKAANKLIIEGHLSTVRTFGNKHIVYIKKQKIVPYPDLRDKFKIIKGERFDMITWNWKRKDTEKYAERQKGHLFQNYRIFKEKKKWGKNKGKKRYVIYGKN